MNTPWRLDDGPGTCGRASYVVRGCPISNRYPRAAEDDVRQVLGEVCVLHDRIISAKVLVTIMGIENAYRDHKRVRGGACHLGRGVPPRL